MTGTLSITFNAKFFCTEAKFILVELRRICQLQCEDLDAYLWRFHKESWIVVIHWLKMFSLMSTCTLCWRNILYTWRIYLASLSCVWWRLRGGRSISKETMKHKPAIRRSMKRRCQIVVVERNEGSRGFSSKSDHIKAIMGQNFPLSNVSIWWEERNSLNWAVG